MEELIPLIAVSGLFGWIPIAVYFKHKIRLEEVKAQRGSQGDAATSQALQELRREVTVLRETTTKFDMSFDAALTRLEERVDRIENRPADAVPTVNVHRGG